MRLSNGVVMPLDPETSGLTLFLSSWTLVTFWEHHFSCKQMAVGQNQWYHFGVGAQPILVYFNWDWDVDWGYGLLTHGQIVGTFLGNPLGKREHKEATSFELKPRALAVR